jgi:hypothetical protein
MQRNQKKDESLAGYGFNVGWYVAFSLIIPTWFGTWLDDPERFHSQPLCTLIGLVVGTTAAGYGLYRMLRRFIKEQKDMDEMYMKKNSIKEQDSE